MDIRDLISRFRRGGATEDLLAPDAMVWPSLVESGIWLFEQDAELRYEAILTPLPGLPGGPAGRTDAELFPEREASRLEEVKRRALETGTAVREEVRLNLEGSDRTFELAVQARRDVSGRITGIVGALVDVTDRQRAHDEVVEGAAGQLRDELARVRADLRHRGRQRSEPAAGASTLDALTGLPGIALLEDRLAMALTHAARHKKTVAVAVVSADALSELRARGRGLADDFLRTVAAALAHTVRQADTIARLDADSFALVLPELQREDDVSVVAQKIRHELRGPFTIGGAEITVTLSMGVALFPQDGLDGMDLLDKARQACDRARAAGGDTYELAGAEVAAAVRLRIARERALRRAIVEEELHLHYQPVRRCRSGELAWLEVLLRWRHAEDGLVPDSDFTAVAETAGLSLPLGQWALRSACAQA